jgi:uncharacterized protein YcaQ
MANNKDKLPTDFQGIIAVIWSGVVDRGAKDFERGNVIDYFEFDAKDAEYKKFSKEEQESRLIQTVGSAVWDDPRFEVIFIKDKTALEMQAMVEPLKDPVFLRRKLAKRKYKYNLDDVQIKDKAVWKKTDSDTTVKEKLVEAVPRPENLVIR